MLDIWLDADSGSNQPQYRQLYDEIRNRITNGSIADGSRLPSVRALQAALQLSKTPIETAYQMLVAEGYAVSKPRSGLFAVAPRAGTIPDAGKQKNGRAGLYPDIPLSERQFREGVLQPPKAFRVDFNTVGVDAALFPLRAWKKALHDTLEHEFLNHSGYGDPQGEYELRAILAEYLGQSRGVVCSPEQIVVGVGMAGSLKVILSLLDPIAIAAIEEPGFRTVRDVFLAAGTVVEPIPVGELGIRLEGLAESKADIVYVTPSHQFPTGAVMPYGERLKLLEWARERGAYIIEDDYDGEFRYRGKPIPSMQSLDPEGRVIYVGTFSKAFAPAFRMNYMVIPEALLPRLGAIGHLLSVPSRMDQLAMRTFIEQGHWYRHIRRMRNAYRRKHQRLSQLLQEHFGDAIAVSGGSAGLHIGVTVRTERSAAELMELAADGGVRVYDYARTWMGSIPGMGEATVYLGFGDLSEEELALGVSLLREAWGEAIPR